MTIKIARIGVTVNSPTLVRALSPVSVILSGCFAVKAWILVKSEWPLALAEETETKYSVPGLNPVTVNLADWELVVLATTKLVAASVTSMVKI